ncbi:MAG: EamA family transporter [Propionibacterium sp.]|nr:MAG: EamA family transporter [Propionibacterium sp.]
MKKFQAPQLAIAALLLMALIWGSTYVVLKGSLVRIPAADMLAVRFTLSLLTLIVFTWRQIFINRKILIQGTIMGILFGGSQLIQTVGLGMTHASVSGFLTGTFVVFTPLIAKVIFGSKLAKNIWISVALSIIGLAVLSITPGSTTNGFGLGEALTLLSAVGFAAHIIATGHFVTPENAISLTIVQTAAVSVLCWLVALPGGVVIASTATDWGAILYLAVIAGAGTLFLQNWAQVYVESSKAAVIMCSEPMWAAFFAVAFGNESITWQMIVGGGAITLAMLIVSQPALFRNPKSLISKTADQTRVDCC